MGAILITVALVGMFLIMFSVSPVYGIAFLTAFRTASILAEVPVGSHNYSAEGLLTLVIIVAGLMFLMVNQQDLKGVLKWPFIIFILYCGLTFFVADDAANFSKKLARLIGYLILYLTVVQLSRKKENIRILSYAFLLSLLVTNVPAVYILFIAPAKYLQQFYSGDSSLRDVGLMSKNNFGFYCCYMLFFMMYLYSAAKTNRSRLLYLILFGTQAALLVMSSTRSAWAGFALAFPLFILYSKSKARLLVPVVAMIIIAACLSSVVYYGAYKELTEKKENGFSSWHFRTAYAWPASIKAFKQKPIMGWGLGNDLYALTKAAKLKNTSHNDYLLVLVETGIIGVLLYVWLLWSLLRRTRQGIRYAVDEGSGALCVSALAIFVAYLVGSIGEHLLQTPGATGYVITVLGMAHGTLLAPRTAVVTLSGDDRNPYLPLPAVQDSQ